MTAPDPTAVFRGRLWLVALAGLWSGCSSSGAVTFSPLPSFEVPQPVPPRADLVSGIASIIYPSADTKLRDPILTAAEQRIAGRLERSAPRPHPETFLQVRRAIHAEVRSIQVGTPNAFLFQGHRYEEGDVIAGTDWVVISVEEGGLHLRSKDGSDNDFIRFGPGCIRILMNFDSP